MPLYPPNLKIWARHLAMGLLGIASWSLMAAPADFAPAAEDSRPWTTMGASTQIFLLPLKDQWPSFSAATKEKWLSLAQRMKNMPPAELERVQARMSNWASLTTSERNRTRLLYQEALRVAPNTRTEQWRRYNELPGDEKQSLAERALQQTDAHLANRSTDHSLSGREPPWAATKINTTPASSSPPPQQLGPSVIQALPGAATALISTKTAPPAHQPAGGPKIVPSPTLKEVRTQKTNSWSWHSN